MTSKPEFRIKRKGYDRFEVDQAIAKLQSDIEAVEKKNLLYQSQVSNLMKQRTLLKRQYDKVLADLTIKEKAAEEMSRLALREANAIIDRAYDNADLIVREAMSSARQILVEIARISNQSEKLRDELKEKIEDLDSVIDGLELPEAPNLTWLSDDQDKAD